MVAGPWGCYRGPPRSAQGRRERKHDLCPARRQPPGGGPGRPHPPAGRARVRERASERSTHPEPWRSRAALEATGFRFPSVWKPTENKPGRQGSPRASGFLEDAAAASPDKVAATGAPRESHVFGRGSRGRASESGGGGAEVTDELGRSRRRPPGQARYPAARAPAPGPRASAALPERRGREGSRRRVRGRGAGSPPGRRGRTHTGRVPARRDGTNRKRDPKAPRPPLSGARAGKGGANYMSREPVRPAVRPAGRRAGEYYESRESPRRGALRVPGVPAAGEG